MAASPPQPLKVASNLAGGLTKLARQLGVTPPTVHEWTVKERKVPEARCAQIERITDGKVTCEQLRPDLPWRRFADAAWPWHKKGGPFVSAADLPISLKKQGESRVETTTPRG